MDLSKLDFVKDVKQVVITGSGVSIEHKDSKVVKIPFDKAPTRLNQVPLDFSVSHAKAVVTGLITEAGESKGFVAHIHHKDGIRIDAQIFPNHPELINSQQGVLAHGN